MEIILRNLDFKKPIMNFKDSFFSSKKYWLLYLILFLLASLSIFSMDNYLHPKMEIFFIFLLSFLGIFCISFYNCNSREKDLYKTAFVIILTFGLLCSFLTPICYAPDEVEHFVRSEMTSRGVFVPEYENDSFITIQTTLDLIENGKETVETGFDRINMLDASLFKTDADTKPINYSSVEYPSAFAQNPFYGYLAQGLGMALAKLLNLNAIWLLWMGRIFNTILYASLIALAVRKTPILKVPLIVMASIPLIIFEISSLSIDSIINGLAILSIAYFFYMYKAPKDSLEVKDIVKFSIIVLLVGFCKVTFFGFIFLIFFVPKDNFKGNNYSKNFIVIVIVSIIALLWSKFYANPGFLESFRSNYWIINNMNSTEQMAYLLSHKKDVLVTFLQLPNYWDTDLLFNSRSLWFNKFNSLYLMFIGAVSLLYPTEKYDIKSRIGSILVILIIYLGTYFSFLLTWTPVGQLNPIGGVQPRYFLPLLSLFPFILGINTQEENIGGIDNYIIMISVLFLAILVISMVCAVY